MTDGLRPRWPLRLLALQATVGGLSLVLSSASAPRVASLSLSYLFVGFSILAALSGIHTAVRTWRATWLFVTVGATGTWLTVAWLQFVCCSRW
jgi:hypothetical protein